MKNKKPTVALFGNTFQIKKNQCVVDVIRLLRLQHINICIERKFADFIAASHQLDLSDCSIIGTQGDFTADVAFSMGGDGTFWERPPASAEKESPSSASTPVIWDSWPMSLPTESVRPLTPSCLENTSSSSEASFM